MSFPGTGKIWMNGSMVDWKDATIHVASHVIHYGSAVFEGARCYKTATGPAIFRLEPHLRRLLESAKIYRMDPGYTEQQLGDAVLEIVIFLAQLQCQRHVALAGLAHRRALDERFHAVGASHGRLPGRGCCLVMSVCSSAPRCRIVRGSGQGSNSAGRSRRTEMSGRSPVETRAMYTAPA